MTPQTAPGGCLPLKLEAVIKLQSKRYRIPNLLVEGGLSHERPSEAWAPPPNTLIKFNVKFYRTIEAQNKTSNKAKTNNS